MMYANVGAVRKVIGNVSFCNAMYKLTAYRLNYSFFFFFFSKELAVPPHALEIFIPRIKCNIKIIQIKLFLNED